MSDAVSIIQSRLGIDGDDALIVLELCDMLAREDLIRRHGYPKDTPSGRDLAEQLDDAQFRARLAALAESEGVRDELLQALAKA